MPHNSHIQSPEYLLLMKVGFHGTESLNEIISRKKAEIEDYGFALWGYGGTLCHPHKVVQPFVNSISGSNPLIQVCFIATPSPYISAGISATEYSIDGTRWEPLKQHTVLDSRFALVLADLAPAKPGSFIDLASYEIAIGPSRGAILSDYFRFRVDKALARQSSPAGREAKKVAVAFMATLANPYAISVRHL